ncbi:MAG: glycine C-acetyltransferase [Planctomycetes bacterium]|jgi:glycine C-acetyltransferase|nr:glycine C-acetyltransferase [Planctomycetota bacterium]MBT4028172.1 glycine C-acetyltransferase [Planctomycetota bacterium]MBT4559784.1 glycine C-acetyltransferase [Planctomycetota bacterium]MBT5101921.1 glycine C-acetyltransferase [Planctomycetota bacterium]MBT5121078.1 glycine C-acetyltransferase [Planctomycetota bacterium]
MSQASKQSFLDGLNLELDAIRDAGLWKEERIITTPQKADIRVSTGESVVNFCANNYLGLSDDPALIQAASDCLQSHGFGMSSVRFICGTQDIHKTLEAKISDFLGFEDCILYTSCFDANGGLYETLLGAEDAVISDALNHASIIDGIRLSKAKRFRYANSDMAELEQCLQQAVEGGARRILVSTDGVFSMDGFVAKLDEICDLAEKYGAMVHVDDSHSTGFMGKHGKGTHEHCGVMGRVDIITSTLGKALGGASGGYTVASKTVVDFLRNKSRPYLFSNSVAPPIVAASIAVFDRLSATTELRDQLEENTMWFREQMTAAGFDIKPSVHPIAPIMLGDAKLAADMASDMLAEGIYVIGFSFPVVPKGQARIRVQISAAHTREHLEKAVAAFIKVGRVHGVIQ